jgi:serine/threonine-protein kinase HipA
VYCAADAAGLPTSLPKINGSKSWPLPKELVEFGKKHCRVDHPEQVIERIASTATEYQPPEESEKWQKMKPLIDHACYSPTV